MRANMKNHIKIPLSERIFYIVSMFIVWLFTLICIYPIWYVLVGSVSSGVYAKYAYFWPQGFSLTTYKQLFARNDIALAFLVSIGRTVIGTVLCVFFTSMLAYLLTQKSMYFRKAIYRYFIITMYINGGMIPWYITLKTYGLVNSFLVYIVPGIISVFNLILTKTFIESLPSSLEESAQLDGAGFFTIFWKIIMPLIKPILATVAVFTAVGQWNTWLDNYILVNKKSLMTLQMILYNYLNQAQQLANQMRGGSGGGGVTVYYSVSAESVRMTMVIITIVPIMLVYPFVQKYFTKGILLGSVKG